MAGTLVTNRVTNPGDQSWRCCLSGSGRAARRGAGASHEVVDRSGGEQVARRGLRVDAEIGGRHHDAAPAQIRGRFR
jgi:hypothetical protein